MDVLDQIRLFQKDFGRPQRVCQITAARLKLGGERTVRHHLRTAY